MGEPAHDQPQFRSDRGGGGRDGAPQEAGIGECAEDVGDGEPGGVSELHLVHLVRAMADLCLVHVQHIGTVEKQIQQQQRAEGDECNDENQD